jgi:hypothetical protein
MINKFKAFLVHLSISLVIFITMLLLCLFAWYPDFYFTASDTQLPIYTMVFVDIGIGPLLTFVVYKHGKPGLLMDLSLIGLFQIAALAGGIWVLYTERPIITVFHQGYFYCLNSAFATAANVDMSKFPRTNNMVPNVFLPEAPTPEEKQHREDVLKKLPHNELPPPFPAFVFGEQFKTIEKDDVAKMLYDEFNITTSIRIAPKYQQRWDKFEAKHPDALKKFAFFPLVCSTEEHLAAVDRNTGHIVDAVEISSVSATKKRFLVQHVAPSLSPVEPLKPADLLKPTESSRLMRILPKWAESLQPAATAPKPEPAK